MSESQQRRPGRARCARRRPEQRSAAGGRRGRRARRRGREATTRTATTTGSPPSHGTRQPGADPEDEAEIEEEREQRLDPENRPDNVEVDNTDRDFDPEKGMFTDSEGYDEAEAKFPAIGGQGA